ncbi:hypothetical protein PHYPSEUDO_004165 [Phytophthora pseudosyringae]|uniref:Uncharacterized protein n=1 Tax=Phytophthora pseudosyringae TaxID=221518 RepID=A0A8T1VPX1_9STRA|nr:hypothetical protein PHYPSEUDO_004165 [Phytophthora pseudosyringae]
MEGAGDAVKTNAAAALWDLSIDNNVRAKIARSGGIEVMAALLRDGTSAQKEKAAGVLRNLSIDDMGQMIIARADGIPPLVALVRYGTDTQKEIAMRALWSLSSRPKLQDEIAAEGGVTALVAAMRGGSSVLSGRAAAVLAKLSSNDALRPEILSAGVLPELLVLMRDGDTFAVTGKFPWGVIFDDAVIKYHLRHRRLMNQPNAMSHEAWALVCAMCTFEPSVRMPVEEVERRVQIFAQAEGEEEGFPNIA